MVIECDLLKILDVNEAFESLTGVSMDQCIGKSITEFSHTEAIFPSSAILHYFDLCRIEGEYTFDWLFRNRDGFGVWCKIDLHKINDGDRVVILAKIVDVVKSHQRALVKVISSNSNNDSSFLPKKRIKEKRFNESSRFAEDHPMEILVVEDVADNLVMIMKILERYGYSVSAAHDGFQALEWLEDNDVDLVLMDLQMPRMSGLDAAAKIREKKIMSGTYQNELQVVALTACSLECDLKKAFNVGMDDYITKPISLKKLEEALVSSYEKLCVSG